MATLEYRIKCQNCGLHYSVYSWDEEWSEGRKGGYCPECGIGGRKLVWGPVGREEFIFQLVPGEVAGGTNLKTGETVEPSVPMAITGPVDDESNVFGLGARANHPDN